MVRAKRRLGHLEDDGLDAEGETTSNFSTDSRFLHVATYGCRPLCNIIQHSREAQFASSRSSIAFVVNPSDPSRTSKT